MKTGAFYHTTSPGKFERVGGKTEKYDAGIYPLYHGYAPGADNTEVYDEGDTNVWRHDRLPVWPTRGRIPA